MSTTLVRPSQLGQILAKTIPTQLPVLITGAPGIGKSDIVTQAAKAANAEIIISHPAVADPTDVKGLPWVANDAIHATFLPYGDLHRAITATKPTVWFLDDLGQAPASVQAGYMQLLLARQVGEHVLPDCISFIAATNRRVDRAGVSGILEPVKSRFTTILELSPTLDDWCSWAIASNVPSEVIAYLRFQPDFLQKFNPTADLVNSPSPRTWANLGKLLNLGLPKEMEVMAFAGAVGEEAAVNFTSFLRLYRDLPNPDAIMMAPDSAIIPKEISTLYAVSTALAARANANNFSRVMTYLERLEQNGYAEYSVLCIRDALLRDKNITTSPAFIKAMSGHFGQLINGGTI
ncbi:MAG: AAA family ATPase [Pseudomonadota bacterium]|nr:AAA family ATPase [Pseudomonadota bacterium]